MRKGGRTFAPKGTQNFTIKMPKKMRQAALFSLLSDKAKHEAIFALEKYEVAQPKTKTFAALIKKLPVERNLLLITAEPNEALEKSSRNLPQIKTILVNYLNPQDILKYRKICFLKSAVEKMETIWKVEKVI